MFERPPLGVGRRLRSLDTSQNRPDGDTQHSGSDAMRSALVDRRIRLATKGDSRPERPESLPLAKLETSKSNPKPAPSSRTAAIASSP